MDQAAYFEKFQSSGQPAVKLRIALDRAFLPDLPENESRTYRDYLRIRIRPAMDACIDGDDAELLQKLEDQGWMENIPLEPFLKRAGEGRRQTALIWLLRRKRREFGFPGPDLSL